MRSELKIGRNGSRFFGDVGFGEFYSQRTGITVSDPRIRDSLESPENRNTGRLVGVLWDMRTPNEILACMRQSDTILVEGDLGSGKSTALYGLRRILREQRRPYAMINGHYLNRSGVHKTIISTALKYDRLVVIDSADYCAKRGGKSQRAAEDWWQALKGHRSAGGQVVMTSHTKPWLDKYGDDESRSRFNVIIGNNPAVVRVGGALEHSQLYALLNGMFNSRLAETYLQLAVSAPPTACTHRVAKVIGNRMSTEGLYEMTSQCFNELVDTIDSETRLKMGVGPDYPLV